MKTLFSKIFVRFVLISFLIIIIFGFSIIYSFKSFYFTIKEEEIIKNSLVIKEHLKEALTENDRLETMRWLETLGEINRGQAWLIDQQGILVLNYPFNISKETRVNLKGYNDIFSGDIVTQRVESSYFEKPMLLVGLPIINEDSVEYYLLLFTPVSGINSTISRVQKIMLYSSLIAIIIAMVLAYSWSRKLSNPLRKMGEVALELSDGNFGKTVDIKENNEIGTLADSLNYMSRTLTKTINNLVEERNKLKYVLRSMEEGVVALNKNKEIILINDSALSLLKLGEGDYVGTLIDDLIDNDIIIKLFNTTIKEKKFFRKEFFLKGEKLIRILVHCTPIYADERFCGIVAMFQDISERWHFEQLQKDFVANVSHELKTPLSSIKGAGEILLDGVVREEERKEEYLELIVEETNRLEELVNNVLVLSELDINNYAYRKGRINVGNLLSDVSNIFKKVIKTDRHKLKTIYPLEELCVYSNEKKLKQVFLNLLDNAYKYSDDEGLIELGAVKDGKEIRFWVIDQGIGIPADELDNIWERFYKVDKAHTPGQSGSGLGLSIVKQIIEDHGGRVYVKSQINEGSEFGFYLSVCNSENNK
jgi:signal transduction histidine kinase